ncbi:MAG: preprotein translocase subunit SecG [Rhodobiaceae bacterium]|jgi:preprotein translocase subunit SecG|nr:preprotein translocase subunit SecG [Rhodobiaceae bacterium]
MTTILLVVHLMIAVAMIVLVLLQRSEGGALGIGGGGGGDGMMSARGLGSVMTRTTGILAGMFFLTSIGLTVLGTMENRASVLDGVIEQEGTLPGLGTLAPAPLPPESSLPTPE